ncbi:unnamed protein product [Moneuplotes crassus]|uniref:Uncharacterized protein n=1 Tax=Euplotes crassus TaxID=5936 RepID=A0AAD2DBU1_EUPCR|nr:unnamed protein product [Moneuplotes crassus]
MNSSNVSQTLCQCFYHFCSCEKVQFERDSSGAKHDTENLVSLNKKLMLQKPASKNSEVIMKELITKYCICMENDSTQQEKEGLSKSKNKKDVQKINYEESKDYKHPKEHDTKLHEEEKIPIKPSNEDAHESRPRFKSRPRALRHDSDSEEFTLYRNRTNYNTRKDVVFKATFRRLRKFFIKDFATSAGNNSWAEDYPQRLREYCRQKFPEAHLDRVCTIFDCVINFKGKLGTIPQEDPQLKDAMNKLLYFYSEKKFRLMNPHPEFFHVLLHFISLENVASLVFNEQRQTFKQKVRAHLQKLKVFATLMKNPEY